MNNKFIRCIGLIIIIFKYYYSSPSPILSKAFSRILVSPTLKVSFLNCFTVCKEKKTDLSCLKETSSASIVENHDATLESSFGYFSTFVAAILPIPVRSRDLFTQHWIRPATKFTNYKLIMR